MKLSTVKTIITTALATLSALTAVSQNLANDELKCEIGGMLTRIAEREIRRCPVKVSSISVRKGRLRINTSIAMSYYPIREDRLQAVYDSVRTLLPPKYCRYEIEIVSDGKPLDELIPFYYRSSVRGEKTFTYEPKCRQLVSRESRPFDIADGLEGRHIALWQSHGRYFDQKKNEWCWQRSLLWQTVEDLFTQSYVLPYLVPMLENAGANVMLPRERDFQTHELIADNDGGVDCGSSYAEHDGSQCWSALDMGFAHCKNTYLSGENPFADGTSRIAATTVEGEESTATWRVSIPETGDYAVYVSYRSLPKSADDALYTVSHAGGKSRFRVNQRIGGGTWIYLGTFKFAEGCDVPVVSLSNRSARKGRFVCADAVKIGGGYGNIARTVCDSLRIDGIEYSPATSGMPRYCEGARYWMQWAGFDHGIYSPKNDADDYKDDYMSRGEWVNTLMGGSERLPKRDGLGIPIDMSLAFHSDAGITDNDDTIGTLGIFYTKSNKCRFEGKVSRYRSRDLTDLIMTQITNDIRSGFDPEWTRRGMWNRSYFEARVPSVPAMLLELLSHQNLADMRYGHDPNFKFTVSRAIYKAILRHISAQYGTPYCVAPLPVEAFSTRISGDDEVTLAWSPVCDSLEATAKPKAYVLYTRIGDGGFDNGRIINDITVVVKQKKSVIYSYRVTAVNSGGESFPSETLAACISDGAARKVMVVNGFDRLSAPASDKSGFHNDFDSGAAYLRDVAFIGEQRVFDTELRREKNDRKALGASYTDRQGKIVGGNTFDYPYLYGKSLVKAGCSFASSSVRAVERSGFGLSQYDAVNLILGKQRTTRAGCGKLPPKYKCFSTELQSVITDYLNCGGALFVSGAYLGTDLFDGSESQQSDIDFAKNVLHFDFITTKASRTPTVTTDLRNNPFRLTPRNYTFCAEYSPECYTVNSTDAIAAAGEGAYEMMRYPGSGLPAAVGYRGAYSTFVMGFPFESITDEGARDILINDIMKFLKPNEP